MVVGKSGRTAPLGQRTRFLQPRDGHTGLKSIEKAVGIAVFVTGSAFWAWQVDGVVATSLSVHGVGAWAVTTYALIRFIRAREAPPRMPVAVRDA